MYLEDFLALVLQYRQRWFPEVCEVRTCCDPAGAADSSHGMRQNAVGILRAHQLNPRWEPNSNAPDVRLAMIERWRGRCGSAHPRASAFR